MRTLAFALIAVFFAASAFGQISWSYPEYVVPGGTEGGATGDGNAAAASDGGGTIIAVWLRHGLPPEPNSGRLHVARSLNGGRSYEPAALLFDDPASGPDHEPRIATDGAGKWMIVWSSERDLLGAGTDADIFYMKSADNGETWIGPLLLNDGVGDSEPFEASPDIASSGDGTWMATWHIGGGLRDVAVARYLDADGSWEAPTLHDAADVDHQPRIASDGAESWIVVAETFDNGSNLSGVEAMRSEDDGATWSAFAPLHADNSVTLEGHLAPTIASDGKGVWLASWIRILGDNSDRDPVYARSVDNGATWTSAAPLGGDPAARQGGSFNPVVATDGAGNWVTTWRTDESWEAGIGGDSEIVYSLTSNAGANWTLPRAVNQNAEEDDENDLGPALLADGRGNWTALWSTSAELATKGGASPDVVTASGFFTGYLEGRVTDAETDGPVGSAAVWARTADQRVDRIEVTDRNGFYRFDKLPAGTYTVSVFATDVSAPDTWAKASASNVVVTAGTVRKQSFAVTSEALEGAVYGTVFGEVIPGSAANRVPLVGARIRAFVNGDAEPALLTYSTGTGRYALSGLNTKGGGTADIVVTFETSGFETDDRLATIAPGENAERNPTLEQKAISFAATLAGLVSDGTTTSPLDEALVVLRGAVNISRTTNGNGVYLFDALPSGTYTVVASKEGFVTSTTSLSVTTKSTVANHNVEMAPVNPFGLPPGDINGDGTINAVDVQLAINGVLGNNLGGMDADVNGDNALNAVDIQIVVNAALGV